MFPRGCLLACPPPAPIFLDDKRSKWSFESRLANVFWFQSKKLERLQLFNLHDSASFCLEKRWFVAFESPTLKVSVQKRVIFTSMIICIFSMEQFLPCRVLLSFIHQFASLSLHTFAVYAFSLLSGDIEASSSSKLIYNFFTNKRETRLRPQFCKLERKWETHIQLHQNLLNWWRIPDIRCLISTIFFIRVFPKWCRLVLFLIFEFNVYRLSGRIIPGEEIID